MSGIVRKILERGWAEPIDTGGKHSAMLNGMHIAGLSDWYAEKLAEVLAEPIITHPNLSDSFSRVRPLILGGGIDAAQAAYATYLQERVEVRGIPQHTTAKSTNGWIFADTAYMVCPSLAIVGDFARAEADLVSIHDALALENGLLRHVLNGSVDLADSYVGIDIWIDGSAWGRAQGWWLAAAADALEVMPSHPAAVVERFARTCASLIDCQSEDGLWRVTVDDEFAPIDTSGTVMIAYGMFKAHQLGFADDAVGAAGFRALEALLKGHLDWRTGALRNQQMGPMIVNIASPNPRYFGEANPYGQGFLAQLYSLAIDGKTAAGPDVRALEPQAMAS